MRTSFSTCTRASLTLLIAVLCFDLTSCSSHTPSAPGAHPGKQPSLKTLYIERQAEDDEGLHHLISREFNQLGLRATAGEPGQAPAGVDALVIYKAEWRQATTPHLASLQILVLDPASRRVVKQAQSQRLPLTRRSPLDTVQEALYILLGIARPDLATEAASRPLMLHIHSLPSVR